MRGEPEWKASKPQMPTDANGNWLNYPYVTSLWETVEHPFYAEFEIDGMRTGRSSKIVVLKDRKTDKTYPMFVADLVKGIQHGHFTVAGAVISGYWTGSKRGANYGIKAVHVDI